MKNLKDNVWIEGFDEFNISEYFLTGVNYTQSNDKEVLFVGKPSDIPEEIAKECMKCIDSLGEGYGGYFDYNSKDWMYHLNTAKESIQSVCNQEYCIIFKK